MNSEHEAAVNSQAQAWINLFLRARGLQKPTGSPLYSYHVSEEEFASLTSALSNTPQQLYSPVYGPSAVYPTLVPASISSKFLLSSALPLRSSAMTEIVMT